MAAVVGLARRWVWGRVFVALLACLGWPGLAGATQDQRLANPPPSDGVMATLQDAWSWTGRGGIGPLPGPAECSAIAANYAVDSPGPGYHADFGTDGTYGWCSLYAYGNLANTLSLDYAGKVAGCDGPGLSIAQSQGAYYCHCSGQVVHGVCTVQPTRTDDYCKSKAGQQSGDSTTKFSWAGGYYACHDGCVSAPTYTYGTGDGAWATGPWTIVGGSCDGSGNGGGGAPPDTGKPTPPSANEDPDTTRCTAPTPCSGTFNGTTICVPCTSQGSQDTTTSSSQGPDGGPATKGDTTTVSHTDNGDGSVTSTTTVTHPDGSTTTSTTNGPKTGNKDNPGFCDQNPQASICKESHFGGACGGSFTCDGDAVQCAIAREQHVRACQMYEPATAGGDWADGAQKLATAKADGDVPSWSPSHPGNLVTTNFDWSTTIDHSSTLSASCPADVVIGDTGAVLPLSSLCPYLGTLGVFIEAMTAIACAFILFKGTK